MSSLPDLSKLAGKTALFVDIGSLSGYALLKDGVVESGTWQLGSAKANKAQSEHSGDRKKDYRVVNLLRILQQLPKPDVVVFEDIEFSTSQAQGQLWASYRTMLWAAFPEADFFRILPVHLKQYATGNARAEKEDMLKSLIEKYPSLYRGESVDDNEVDALWLMLHHLAVLAGSSSYYVKVKKLKKPKKKAKLSGIYVV